MWGILQAGNVHFCQWGNRWLWSCQVPDLELTPVNGSMDAPVVVHGTYFKSWPAIQEKVLQKFMVTAISHLLRFSSYSSNWIVTCSGRIVKRWGTGWPKNFISWVYILTKIVCLEGWGGGLNPLTPHQFEPWLGVSCTWGEHLMTLWVACM